MRREPRGAGAAQRQDAAVPDPRDPGRPRDRRRLPLRPEARPHHLPGEVDPCPASRPRRPLRPRPHPPRLRPGRARRLARRPSQAYGLPASPRVLAEYRTHQRGALGRLQARRDRAARCSSRGALPAAAPEPGRTARPRRRLRPALSSGTSPHAATDCRAADGTLAQLRRRFTLGVVTNGIDRVQRVAPARGAVSGRTSTWSSPPKAAGSRSPTRAS